MFVVAILTSCGASVGSSLMNFPAAAPANTVSGTVTFKGNPLPGATVIAFVKNTNTVYQTTKTNADGNYKFSGIETSSDSPAKLQLWVNKSGYGFYPSATAAAKVTRADHTADFMSNAGSGINNIPIHFTVIDYVALPDASLTAANFAAYNGTNFRVTLARTGQTISYAPGDDASLHKGVPWPGPRFADNQDGTVTDNLTGLIWLQNATCFSATIWSTALTEVNQLATGACDLNDGSTAGQWRLPNLNELESLIDVSASNPAVPAGSPFSAISNGVYWSSTSYFDAEGGSPHAWSIRFSDGRYMNDSTANVKASANNEVWAVKGRSRGVVKLQSTGMYVAYTPGDDGSVQAGVPPTYPRWVDNRNGTITDTVTSLIWLKRADCINQPWPAAVAAVDNLASGQCGLTDGTSVGTWRMPNRNEMQSLGDRMQNNHAAFFDQTYILKASPQTIYQAPIFTNFVVSDYYWTSTTNATDPTEAWTVFSNDFGVYNISKTNTGYTLAVR